ncbi:MAG: hypothetical protein R3C05_19595 [Pirellulaceae bacterium]
MLLLIGLFAICGLHWCAPASAQPKFDGLVSQEQMEGLKGKPAVIRLSSGVVIDDARVLNFIADPRTGSTRFLQYQTGARRPKVKVEDVHRILIDGQLHRFRYAGSTKSHYLINMVAAGTDVKDRLQNQDSSLREPQTEKEIIEAVADQAEILNQAERDLAPRTLVRLETRYTLILSDFPAAQAQQVGVYLDNVCDDLNNLFGLPKHANIWRGKAIIALFHDNSAYAAFNKGVMQNPNFGNLTTILYHNRRRFAIVGICDRITPGVGRNLCSCLAAGYVARYRSDVSAPDWIERGISKNMVRRFFPDPKRDAAEDVEFRERLVRQGSLNGLLTATDINNERNPDCGNLVSFLVEADPRSFSEFFEDIKLGVPCEESMKLNYGIDFAQFATLVGRQYGCPNTTP